MRDRAYGRLMTTTIELDLDRKLVARAAAVGAEVAKHAARHDAEGTFVEEGLDCLRESGLLALAVPVELGGSGGTIRQVAMV
ncbi:MAG: hypothetical protein QOJ67_605, partial [Acidimicrobiaceae bacterium]